ncbi:MAG: methyltransferase domain-containing protein [Rhodospirillales bacterium]|nr:methyltransferase domain-containing protein [Rhodospirillales bacterium]
MSKPISENDPIRKSTVTSYSSQGSKEYEDPLNKNFLYGDITVRFLEQISFQPDDTDILDLGCGTGFVFDELQSQFREQNMQGTGIEPAEGMLKIAIEKYENDKIFSFDMGSFEEIPLNDKSQDKIISTLALHWVKSLEIAATEMRRVLRDTGSLDILMIAKNDGAIFKKAIVNALRNHLTFAQIIDTAALVQRVTPEQVKTAFSPFDDCFKIEVQKFDDVVYGTFDEHMKWWKARSSPVIAEVKDKNHFMIDLREELEKIGTDRGIPFDTSYYWITAKAK